MSSIKSDGVTLLSRIKNICVDGAVCETIATIAVVAVFFGSMVVALAPTI